MAVTIADVARSVGRSPQLVSAVLNGGRSSSAASEATRRRVLEAARRLGYRPNAAARAVSTGRFGAVGLLLSTSPWKSSLPPALLDGIRDVLAERDMHLSLSWFDDVRLTRRGQMPKILRQMMADGLLVKYDSQVPRAMVEALSRGRVPAVWINSIRDADCVHPDDRSAGRAAAERLIALGHRRVAWADHRPRPPSDHYSSSARREGYEEAMRSAGLAPRAVTGREPVAPGERVGRAKRWLTRPDRPTAVVTCSPEDGMPVAHAAALLGLAVPRDLSVVTFGDGAADKLGLSLTTFTLPQREMGRAATEMLLAKIAEPQRRFEPRVLEFGLAEGATCAPPGSAPHASPTSGAEGGNR